MEIEKLDEEGELDFVPPKIDLSSITGSEVQTMERPEVTEAKKRGEGVALGFKRPDQKTKKQDDL
jgi:hypothetical protein